MRPPLLAIILALAVAGCATDAPKPRDPIATPEAAHVVSGQAGKDAAAVGHQVPLLFVT